MRAIHADGVDYLLIGDGYVAASDMRADPERWGLAPVFDQDGARLYRIE